MTSRIAPFIPHGGSLVVDAVPVYNNSGPVPNHAYRTGEVGLEVEISAFFIMGQLFSLANVPIIGTAINNNTTVPMSPLLVDAAVCAALVLLGHATPAARARLAAVARDVSRGKHVAVANRKTVDCAITRLETLRDALKRRGLLTPFYGVVRANDHDRVKAPFVFPWLAGHADHQALTLAWGLMAIACASPPILLFSRQPTLACFRSFSQLTLRWLGAHTFTTTNATVIT